MNENQDLIDIIALGKLNEANENSFLPESEKTVNKKRIEYEISRKITKSALPISEDQVRWFNKTKKEWDGYVKNNSEIQEEDLR